MNKASSQFSKHSLYLSSFLSLSLALACASSNPSEPVIVEPEGEITDTPCDTLADCDDGAFCNGSESCDNGFCRLGVTPRCDDGIECTKDVCSHKTGSCQFLPPDEDADGHADANCTGPDGEALGDDCDDDDPNRYPGNSEICSKEDPTHDEDCDAKSYGSLDEDADGETSDSCCNEDANGETNCGPDCDDKDYRRNHDYPEICDDIDNDCDGKVDKNTKEVLWYPDTDGDHFGTESDDAILSCAPVENRSLRASDCNDQESAVHIAAREECDGVDNDCDGDIDEAGVCACAPQGNARPCSCGGSLTGIQVCDGGLWNSCDCNECVTGNMDCVGELLPRECIAGRWQVRPACRGIRPICLEGECMCADGSDDCIEIADIFRPYVKDSVPLAGSVNTPAGASLAVEFSEDIAPASAAGAVVLTDALGTVLSGTVSVGGSTLYFVPDEALGAGQAYQFHVESSVTDLAGNALLAHSPVNFRTIAGLTAARIGGENTRTLSEPVLAVNEAGAALLLVTNSAAPGYPGAPPYTTASTFQETKFVGGNVVSFGTQDFRIAFDGSDQFLIGEANNTEHAVYFLSDSGSAISESLSTDAMLSLTPVFANPAGAAMAIFSNAGELQVAAGAISGFSTTFALPNSSGYIQEITGDVGDSGQGIVAFRNNNVHVYLSDVNLENWQPADTNPAFIDILNLGTVLTANNTATIAWNGWTSGGSQGSAYQVFIQELGSNGEWIGSPVQPRGTFSAGNEMSPLLAADSNDNLILSYVRGTQVVAITRTQDGSWGDEVIFNSSSDLNILSRRLKVTGSGEAVLGWISHSAQPGTSDLWVARYSPQTGWRPARLVEDETSNITAFDLGIDGDGHVLIVYTASNTEDAVWVGL